MPDSGPTLKKSRLPAPRFSHTSGFYPEPFDLWLSHPQEQVRIYYTLDGSEPDPDNLQVKSYAYKNHYKSPDAALRQGHYQTHLYHQAIQIKERRFAADTITQISTTADRQPQYLPGPVLAQHWLNKMVFLLNKLIREINRGLRNFKSIRPIAAIGWRKYKKPLEYTYKGTPVRALAIDQAGRRSKIVTHTLFVGRQSDFTLPIIAINAPAKDLFNYANGIFVAGRVYDQAHDFDAGQDTDIAPELRPYSWNQRGFGIKANFELITTKGINQRVKIRTHGNSGRQLPQKALRLYPPKAGLAFDAFEDGDTLGLQRLNLRCGGDRRDLLADAAAAHILTGLNFGVQKSRPYVMFLNGEYNGIFNARNRMDKRYLQHYYGFVDDHFDLIEHRIGAHTYVIKYGSDSIYRNHVLAHLDNYNELCKYIDIDSFIDYQCGEIYLANQDWPGNNNAYWRYAGTNYAQSPLADGKFRWLLYDLDAAFADPQHPSLKIAAAAQSNTPNPDYATQLFYSLLRCQAFKLAFLNRFADLLNSHFMPKRTIGIIDAMQAAIELEMPRQIRRWQYPKDLRHWYAQVNKKRNFLRARPAIQRQQLQEFFQLDGQYHLALAVNAPELGTIRLNSLHLGLADAELDKPMAANERAPCMQAVLALPWRGAYFNAVPIRLEAIGRPGASFSHWQAQGLELSASQRKSPILTLSPANNINISAHFKLA